MIFSDESVVSILQDGLKEAQKLLQALNMVPSIVARQKKWFTTPWIVERADPFHLAYVLGKKPEPGEDGSFEYCGRSCNPNLERKKTKKKTLLMKNYKHWRKVALL